jgi:hypothetical protein
MQDPKENLKKLLKKVKTELDPEGAKQDAEKEAKDETDGKLDSVAKGTDRMAEFLDKLKGDDGYTPVKGKDYFTEEELSQIKEEVTPILGKDFLTEQDIQDLVKAVTPIKGEHYFTQEEIDDFIEQVTPKKGVDYDDGKDAKEIDIEEIVDEVLEKIPPPKNGEPGKDGKDATPEEVIEAIKKLPEKKKLDISHLRNSAQIQSAISKMIKGGGITGVNTKKITVSDTAPLDPRLNDIWINIS